MIYRVTARLKSEAAFELQEKLRDGTILTQRPDGGEIVAALNRAVVVDSGQVQFSIGCYCSTPLAHERATVFDRYFDELTTEVIDGHQQYEGRSFIAYLAELVDSSNHTLPT